MAKIYVISGPSGSGKSTITKQLLASNPNMRLSVSATTRLPRTGERHGSDYFFITKEEFDVMIAQNAFYEYAEVYENKYGTPKSEVDQLLEKGFDVLLEIDVQGALRVKKINPRAVLIFVMPPDIMVLRSRLESRNSESEEQLRLRLEKARHEMRRSCLYDHIVVNDDLQDCVAQIQAIIGGQAE